MEAAVGEDQRPPNTCHGGGRYESERERERWKRGTGVEGDRGVASLFDELTNRSIVMLIYLLIVPLLVCTDIFCVFNDRYIVHGINEDIEPVW